VTNGGVAADEDSTDGSHSPKLKHKSQKSKERKSKTKSREEDKHSVGLLRKLRGGAKSDSTDSTGSKSVDKSSESVEQDKNDERIKRKAFVHYDCQSIGVSLADVIKMRICPFKRRNTTTGASAASISKTGNPTEEKEKPSEDSDAGDNKSNDLLLSCSYFRNELGGEEERTIYLNRATAQKRVQQLLGNKELDSQYMMKRPDCNGVAVLDTSQSPHGIEQLAIVRHNGLVIEHVDHGASYYNRHFHNFGKYFSMHREGFKPF